MSALVGTDVGGVPEDLALLWAGSAEPVDQYRRLARQLDRSLEQVRAGTTRRFHVDSPATRRLRQLAGLVEDADRGAARVGADLAAADRGPVAALDVVHRLAIADWLAAQPAGPGEDAFADRRVRELRRLLEQEPDVRVLSFEPKAGPDGEPVLTVLVGDLATAVASAVLVPGTTHGAHTIEADLRTARDLRAAAQDLGRDVAVVVDVWDAPDDVVRDAPRTVYGREHEDDLARTTQQLRALAPGLPVTLVGHSYGSYAAGRAASAGAAPDRLVLVGTPGVGQRTAADLGLDHEDVFVARAPRDPIEIAADADEWFFDGYAPAGFALGPDPADAEFGARAFQVNDVATAPDDPLWVDGHSEYFLPGSRSLENIARIVAGLQPTTPDPDLHVPWYWSADDVEWRLGSDGARMDDHTPWSGGSW